MYYIDLLLMELGVDDDYMSTHWLKKTAGVIRRAIIQMIHKVLAQKLAREKQNDDTL